MPNLNITNIPAPRVPFIDERTGLMAREWYRFFLNLFVLTGSGNNPITLEELQIGPPNQPDLAELLIQINQNIAPQYEDQSGDFLATLDTAQLMSMMSRFENAEAAIQGAYLQPPQLPVDGVYVVGPGSSTDNAIARFDGTTGKLIQNSVTTIDDTGAATGFTTFAASTSVTTPTVQASNSAGLSLKNASGTTQINIGAGGGDNVSINVSTNLNGANAQIDISPTGTGHVHIKPSGTGSIEIAPTNVGTIDNMTIGATAPKNGSFVDLSVTGTTSFDGAQGTAGQVLTSAGTGATPTWTTPTTGTVTSVAALTLGTSGTDLTSTVANGTTTPVITLQVPTASASNRGALSSTDWSTFNSKGSGTVTTVSFTGGIVTVANPTTTPAFTIAGTSGGIPYFSSASTWATSAALAAGALVQGGGAGVAPSTITTGTGVVTALGVNTGTAGAFVVNGGALGTPSSGTVTNLTGTASININGTVGATTAATGAFTTVSASGNGTFNTGGGTQLGLRLSDYTAGGVAAIYNGANANNSANYAIASSTTITYINGSASSRMQANSTDIAVASSTGLAVTGTLSSTGNLTVSGTAVNILSTSSPALVLGGGGAGANVPVLVLDGGSAASGGTYIALRRNSANVGFIGTSDAIVGGGLNDIILYGVAGSNVNIYANAAKVGAFSSTGLAVTGALSATGVVTFSNYGAGAATFDAAGVISSVSDETWKTKDGVPTDPDAMLKKLKPGYWYYNDEKKKTFSADRQLGFYAQNVNAAIGPEAAPEPEEGKPWGYYDRSVLAITVMSLQKALATIEKLSARLEAK